jgi:uncharacterized protein (TIGR03435 family)
MKTIWFLLSLAIAAQQPAFEVASVKQSQGSGASPFRNVVWLPGERMSATALTLAELIRSAYVGDGIQLMSQIAGGPDWVTKDRIDIVGKLTGIATGDPAVANRQRQIALRALLVDRFKLKAHIESRELHVFDLVPAETSGALGPQIKPSMCGHAGERPCVPSRMVRMDPATGLTMAYEGMTMAQLASALVSMPEIGRPVRNRTGLSGTYDLQLTLPLPNPNAPDSGGVVTALREQLGLKLDGRRDAADVIVIDSAERPAED